jgi:streptogramin lyase
MRWTDGWPFRVARSAADYKQWQFLVGPACLPRFKASGEKTLTPALASMGKGMVPVNQLWFCKRTRSVSGKASPSIAENQTPGETNMTRIILATLVLGMWLLGPLAGEEPPPKLELQVVPTPVKSYRLLAMSRDSDGFLWAGSIHQAIHRYDPRTGNVETVPLPVKATASSCLCVGQKVYILGQSYSRLIVYDRSTKEFKQFEYPSQKPNVWYGTEAVDGRYLYLFDRGSAGVIKWDTQTDTGKAIAWPYKTPLPGGGHYEPGDKALWCKVWDNAGGQYVPVGLARLDVAKDTFTDWLPFPKEDKDLKPYTDPKTTFFLPHTLKGKVVPFDFKEKRWCQYLSVRRFGDFFAFIGGPVVHQGRSYFSLSTYNGTNKGCDGQPYCFASVESGRMLRAG